MSQLTLLASCRRGLAQPRRRVSENPTLRYALGTAGIDTVEITCLTKSCESSRRVQDSSGLNTNFYASWNRIQCGIRWGMIKGSTLLHSSFQSILSASRSISKYQTEAEMITRSYVKLDISCEYASVLFTFSSFARCTSSHVIKELAFILFICASNIDVPRTFRPPIRSLSTDQVLAGSCRSRAPRAAIGPRSRRSRPRLSVSRRTAAGGNVRTPPAPSCPSSLNHGHLLDTCISLMTWFPISFLSIFLSFFQSLFWTS